MENAMQKGEPIDREVTGAAVTAAGLTVTPVAHIKGRQWRMADGAQGASFGWVAIRPVRMNIQDGSGRSDDVALVNAEAQALRGMAAVGLGVAVLSLFVSWLARRAAAGCPDCSTCETC